MELRVTEPDAPEAARLIAALDADLRLRYPGLPTHGIDPDTLRQSGGVFVVAWLDGQPAACGAFRPIDAATIEIKRMFVEPGYRRRGLSRVLLAHLEALAAERGFTRVILETGVAQPEAIALYEATGYTPIERYGEYADDVHSLFFGKSLGEPTAQRGASA